MLLYLDTTDYIVYNQLYYIETESDEHTDETYGTITWNSSKQYT